MNFVGMRPELTEETVRRLKNGKRYLKGDFNIHLQETSECADHCLQYALSSGESEFTTECDHQHSMSCDRCDDLLNLLEEMKDVCNTE